MAEVKIQRHIKIKDNHHDGDIGYWNLRKKRTNISDKSSIFSKVYTKQNGCCASCKARFGHDDNIELDHIVPKSLNGEEKLLNYQLLHNYCHDVKTTLDGSLRSRCKSD